MALTRETIVANAALANLTDDQIKALETLSANDENTVIGKKTGEIYREMDTKIEAITGVKRNGDEKTYLYLERATEAFKKSADELEPLKKQVGELSKEKERLDKLVKEGATDAETKRQLDQAQKDLAAVTNQYNTLKTEHDTAKQTFEKDLFVSKVENDLAIATSGIKFKSEFPESVTKVLLSQALEKVKAMNPEYIDNGQGGKVLAFKDETGAHRRNPENQLNPFTAAELLQSELKTLGVLDEGRQQQGGGTGGNGGGTGGGGNAAVQISGAKTRVEANELIGQQLMQKGLTVGSDEYQTAMNEAWKENNVSALPEQ